MDGWPDGWRDGYMEVRTSDIHELNCLCMYVWMDGCMHVGK